MTSSGGHDADAQNLSGANHRLERLAAGWAERYPHHLGLADPADKAQLGLGRPRRLTHQQIWRAGGRLAFTLNQHGLRQGDIVAIQLPNVAETIIAMLGCWRAGVTAAMLPMAWQGSETGGALGGIPVAGAIGCWLPHQRWQSAALACSAGAGGKCFTFDFGLASGHGLTALDDIFDPGFPDAALAQQTGHNAGGLLPGQPAMLHVVPQRGGYLILPRLAGDLLAHGLHISLELKFSSAERLLSPFPVSGITGTAGFLMPWLVTGSALFLHQPFNLHSLREQIASDLITYTALPAALLPELAGAGISGPGQASLRRLGAVWPLPLAAAAGTSVFQAPALRVPVHQLLNIGDYVITVRPPAEEPGPISLPLGFAATAALEGDAVICLETRLRGRTQKHASTPLLSGSLALRGALLPADQTSFVALNPDTAAAFDADGFLQTHLDCAFSDAAMTMLGCLPAEGVARLGGVVLDFEELDRLYRAFPDCLDAAAFAIPDPLLGERIFAALVPRPGREFADAAFFGYLKTREIAAYKAPEKIIALAAIPRDERGRILRASIVELALA